MVELWFGLLCFMLTVFIVLDGWDIGAGVVHLLVAKTEAERREVIAALGPLWSWHEVWLLAAGGTFVLAFPKAMAASFAGFYLALWMVLWSFLLRGVSIEVGGHIHDRLWQTGWDVVFAAASVCLAVLFGAALGNVIRGVPLDGTGKFSMSLFTDFTPRGRVGILDWYTLSAAMFAAVVLAAHGSTYLRLKTIGLVHDRSERMATRLWIAALVLFPVVSIETWIVRPELYAAMVVRPLGWLAIVVIAGSTWALWIGLRGQNEGHAFAGSCGIVAGLMAGLAVGVFPVLLHSTLGSEHSMTAYMSAAEGRGLLIASIWWPIAAAMAFAYLVIVARSYSGKVKPAQDTQGYY